MGMLKVKLHQSLTLCCKKYLKATVSSCIVLKYYSGKSLSYEKNLSKSLKVCHIKGTRH